MEYDDTVHSVFLYKKGSSLRVINFKLPLGIYHAFKHCTVESVTDEAKQDTFFLK
jgi:hypothetical protein